MSAWNPITEADLRAAMTSVELRIFSTILGESDDTEDAEGVILDQVIGDTVALVRGRVAVKYTLAAGQTIPDSLRGPAMTLIKYALFARVGRQESLEDQARAARDWLRDVARGTIALPEADAETDVEIGSLGPNVSGRTRRFDRASQDGV